MGYKVIKFKNGVYLEFDQGSFDNWCVYLTDAEGNRSAPRDTDYFTLLKEFSKKYGAEQIYKDFVSFYEITGKETDPEVFESINKLSSVYGDNCIDIEIIFCILYMGMIAEENKKFTKLGKRIKRLGVYTLLIDDESVYKSANFMRGMNYKTIDELCKKRGF
ncbi:hypothetical protein [Veillonella sp. CHU732]|uniref:DUF7004 family protein n=1 Tax=Veillonella sp. CHU732 TaxID=2490949 RepID=UPI000F8EA868|nr:hypothetical protein [Veillonella sp. CHU732]